MSITLTDLFPLAFPHIKTIVQSHCSVGSHLQGMDLKLLSEN